MKPLHRDITIHVIVALSVIVALAYRHHYVADSAVIELARWFPLLQDRSGA